MSYVICNIGNHDVQFDTEVVVDGVPCERAIPGDFARKVGEAVWRQLDSWKPHLKFPLIKAITEYLKDSVVHEIVLVTTDQVDSRYRAKDTVFFAQIIAEHLRSQPFRNGIAKIARLSIDMNPADYDNMYAWYRVQFSKLKNRFLPEEAVYFALAGGTPAMNTATLLHAVAFFGAKAEGIYTSPGDKRPIPLRIGRDLTVKRSRDEILSLISTYDFYAARERVVSLATDVGGSDEHSALSHLLAYAHARASFDFEAALHEIEHAIRIARGHRREELQTLRSDLYHEEKEFLLAELAATIRVKAKRGEFIDLLARIFRFQEEALRLIVERLGGQFNSDGKRLNLTWLEKNPGLKRFLDEYRVDGAPLEYSREVNRKVLKAILEYYREVAHDDLATKINVVLERFEQLAKLRNRTTHGFTGVSQKLLEEKYQGPLDRLLADLDETVLLLIGCPSLEPSFYERIGILTRDLLDSIA